MTKSKAYEEGFSSRKYLNPYSPGSSEFNEFERGWGQRVKRDLPVDPAFKIDIDELEQDTIEYRPKRVDKPVPQVKQGFEDLKKKYGVK